MKGISAASIFTGGIQHIPKEAAAIAISKLSEISLIERCTCQAYKIPSYIKSSYNFAIRSANILHTKEMELLETIVSIKEPIIDIGKAAHALVLPFFKTAQSIENFLTPLGFFSWVNAPFMGLDLALSVRDFVKAPGILKSLPALNIAIGTGYVAESVADAAILLEDVGVAAAQNVSIWALPLTGAAVGLQSLSMIVNGWGLIEASYALKKLNFFLGNEDKKEKLPTIEEYRAAVKFLTKDPDTRMERFRAKFFKILNSYQEGKIKRIFDRFSTNVLDRQAIAETFEAVKLRFTLKKIGYGLLIAAAIVGIIGVTILCFAPTPLAPLAWVLIGASAAITLSALAINFFGNQRLDKVLSKYDKEEGFPWYLRSIVWLRKKKNSLKKPIALWSYKVQAALLTAFFSKQMLSETKSRLAFRLRNGFRVRKCVGKGHQRRQKNEFWQTLVI